MKEKQIPYKIYLEESEMPKTWYNVRADMENKPAPLLNPGTLKPMTAEELSAVFCEELVAQELDNDNRYIDIPQEILDFYKMYRPRPWCGHTVWRRNWIRRRRFIISLKEIIPAEAINLTPPLRRPTMPRSKGLKG